MSTHPTYLTLGLLEEATMHLARAAQRKVASTFRIRGPMTSDEKSWVPSKTATQRLPQLPASLHRACLRIRHSRETLVHEQPRRHRALTVAPATLRSGSPASSRTLLRPKRRREQNRMGNTFNATRTKRCSTPRQVIAHRGTLYCAPDKISLNQFPRPEKSN